MRSIEDYIQEMQEDSARWFEYDDFTSGRLLTFVLGLCGESGEVADLLKKHLRGSKTYEEMKEEMVVELIDVFHYWCLLIGLLGVDVDAVYQLKREFNVQRYERGAV
jgi:NTP pyrophosphatase (non-canonical NTP hydrolase)